MTTVRELVFGDHAGEVQAAERFAHDVSIANTAVSAVAEALEFEVSDVLVWAWKTRSALLAAARETHATPGLVHDVTVKTYAVPWDYEMQLDVLLNGVRTATVAFVLSISLEVTALAVTVQDGMLTSVKAGRFKASALLQAEGRILAQREMTFDLAVEVEVGDGIPLIPEAIASADDQSSEVSRS
jgi:hypothetical protein